MTTKNNEIANKPTGLSRSDNPAIAADPPAASDVPLRGQLETNSDSRTVQDPGGELAPDRQGKSLNQNQPRQAAYDFGWRTALQYGRDRSTPLAFEPYEAELETAWSKQQGASGAPLPWRQAREAAREAWTKVQDAIVGGPASNTAEGGTPRSDGMVTGP